MPENIENSQGFTNFKTVYTTVYTVIGINIMTCRIKWKCYICLTKKKAMTKLTFFLLPTTKNGIKVNQWVKGSRKNCTIKQKYFASGKKSKPSYIYLWWKMKKLMALGKQQYKNRPVLKELKASNVGIIPIFVRIFKQFI